MSLVLNKNNYKEYLYKTYSAWLGKNIGIRLGAPVENWTHEQIIKTYGDKVGYLVDYDIFEALNMKKSMDFDMVKIAHETSI